jgi:hypothetical protein
VTESGQFERLIHEGNNSWPLVLCVKGGGGAGQAMFPANARTLLLRPSGRGVLLGDDNYNLPVVGKSRHRTAIDALSSGRKLVQAVTMIGTA